MQLPRSLRTAPLLALLSIGGCDDHLFRAESAPCLRDPPLTWESWGEAEIRVRCAGCHSPFYEGDERAGAPDEVDLYTWDDVLLWADRIYARAVVDESMPPNGGINDAERALLDEWLRCEVLPAAGRL